MSDSPPQNIDSTKTESNAKVEENDIATEKKDIEENKENKDDKIEEEKEDKKEEKKEEKNEQENEDVKSDDEEKEKSEDSKESDSEDEESKNSKESEDEKDKEEEEKEDNEEDDEDDDIDVDDDEGNSESSSYDRQKDPYHSYLNSKTSYRDFFNDLVKQYDYIYGINQNKFYKMVDMKTITSDKKVYIFKYGLKEIKIGQKVNTKLIKNIQYMSSIYGKEKEPEKNNNDEKDKKDEKENKKIVSDKKDEKKEENKDIKENKEEPKDNKEENKKEEKNELNKEDIKENKEEPKENQEENKKEGINEINKEDIKENKEENKKEEKSEEKENKGEEKEKEKTKGKKEKNKDKKDKKKSKKKSKDADFYVVIKDMSEYIFFQKIRVVYVNSQNNPIIFYLKINMNTTIKEIIDQFISLYHYKKERYSSKNIPLHFFINGKKHSKSNKTRSKYFIPTRFDYKNDYILILEKQVLRVKELDLNTDRNYLNLRGVDIPHFVYNSLFNFEIDSFIISQGVTTLDCKIYELKNEINLRQFTDNERSIKLKAKEFLSLNWKEKTNFVTSFKSAKAKKSKENRRANLFELNRKFILLEGKMYIFVIKSPNKRIYAFGGRRTTSDGVYIFTKNDKAVLNGFRGKDISDFVACS